MNVKELIKITEDTIKAGGEAISKPYTVESKFQDRLIRLLKNIYKEDIWFVKVSDRYISGIPDIVGCIHGVFFAFELKDDIGVPSKIQCVVIEKIRKAGGRVWVVRTIEEVLKSMIIILKTLEE